LGEEALNEMRKLMERLGLTVNEEKTKLVKMPEGSFVFLGYEFANLYSWKLDKMFLGARPSKKALKSLRDKVREAAAANMGCLEASQVVKKLNWVIRGWAIPSPENILNFGCPAKKVFEMRMTLSPFSF
jgi:hypothetical protein